MNASLPVIVGNSTVLSTTVPYDPPLKITIPLPTEIPRLRGILATTKYGGNLRVRCSNAEYDLIQQEANKIGLTINAFMRFVGRAVAKALKEHRTNGSTSIAIELNSD